MNVKYIGINLLAKFYSWKTLKKRYTPEEAEEIYKLKGNKEWEEFKSKIQSGDKLYYYSNIGPLSGSAGLCIVRNGEHVEHYKMVFS